MGGPFLVTTRIGTPRKSVKYACYISLLVLSSVCCARCYRVRYTTNDHGHSPPTYEHLAIMLKFYFSRCLVFTDSRLGDLPLA